MLTGNSTNQDLDIENKNKLARGSGNHPNEQSGGNE